MSLRLSFLSAVLSMAVVAPAFAEDPKPLITSGDWEAYAYTEGGNKVCYAAARAARPNDKDRAGTAIAVTNRPKSAGEVSLIGSYGFKKDSDVDVQIGAKQYSFFTRGNSAWAKDAGADKDIIAAMVRGREVAVKATPAKGAVVTDTISLIGFTAALAAIDKACGVKR